MKNFKKALKVIFYISLGLGVLYFLLTLVIFDTYSNASIVGNLSNTKQIAQGLEIYASENDNLLPLDLSQVGLKDALIPILKNDALFEYNGEGFLAGVDGYEGTDMSQIEDAKNKAILITDPPIKMHEFLWMKPEYAYVVWGDFSASKLTRKEYLKSKENGYTR